MRSAFLRRKRAGVENRPNKSRRRLYVNYKILYCPRPSAIEGYINQQPLFGFQRAAELFTSRVFASRIGRCDG